MLILKNALCILKLWLVFDWVRQPAKRTSLSGWKMRPSGSCPRLSLVNLGPRRVLASWTSQNSLCRMLNGSLYLSILPCKRPWTSKSDPSPSIDLKILVIKSPYKSHGTIAQSVERPKGPSLLQLYWHKFESQESCFSSFFYYHTAANGEIIICRSKNPSNAICGQTEK